LQKERRRKEKKKWHYLINTRYLFSIKIEGNLFTYKTHLNHSKSTQLSIK